MTLKSFTPEWNQTLTLWLGAFRYYLGRQTYAVSDFCELLAQEWNNLDSRTQTLILKELKEAIKEDDDSRLEGRDFHRLGDDCDRAEWVALLQTVTAASKQSRWKGKHHV